MSGCAIQPPLISVLLPVRDAERTVERAVQSVLAQTFSDLELVAVNDASSDGTPRRLARLAQEDPRIRLVEGPGLGLVRALQVGLAHCRARYIARMDADDECLPSRLERSLLALEADGGLAAVGTGVEIFREDRPVSPNLSAYGRWLSSLTTPERLFRDRLVESPLCHPAATIRRSALEAVGGFEEGNFPEDWQLWLKLLAAGWSLVNLPEVLFRWRDHDRRLTRTDPRYSRRNLIALKAQFLAETVLPRGRPCILWGAGELGLALARGLLARGVKIACFVELNPRKVGQRIHGAEVIAPRSLGPPGDCHLVAAVGAKGAREEIRAHLEERGWREGVSFTAAG